jgi:ribosomal 30S subunit maturation factor RimM
MKSTKRSDTNDPLRGMYVYVGDYIGACVKNQDGSLLGHISQAALHGTHSIFLITAVTGHTDGKYLIPRKKLLQGNAQWHPQKEILAY